MNSKTPFAGMSLSEAASIMRNPNSTPEQRSEAASVMGREGGKHSHDHDSRPQANVREKESVDH